MQENEIVQKTIKMRSETVESIEQAAQEDFRSFSSEVQYLAALGLRARKQADTEQEAEARR